MSKHTPGPWTAISSGTAHNEEKHTIRASDGTWIAETIPHQPKGWSQEANARLIAAAPDLLAELRRTREWVAQYLEIPSHAAAAQYKVSAIDAAIAKAEGN
jgi:uncharacterized RmlC-like cupin family protein